MADVVWDRPSICANTQSFHLPAVVAARVKSISERVYSIPTCIVVSIRAFHALPPELLRPR